VVGYRTVIIRPAEEHFPDVDLEPLVVRKTKDGLMVTPKARIPFNGKVTDKFGLSEVRMAYTLAPVEIGGPSQGVEAALLAASVPMMNPEGHSYLLGITYLSAALKDAGKTDKQLQVQYLGVAGFEDALKESNQIYDGTTLLNLATVRERLNSPQKAPYRSLLREFHIKPDKWQRAESDDVKNDFLMSKIRYNGEPLLEPNSLKTQRRYRMQLWLEGVNTDVDTDPNGQPKVSPSKDRFPFIVVSEGELLAEINKEEEGIYTHLEEVMNRLVESDSKLNQLLDGGLAVVNLQAADFDPMVQRTIDVDEVLDKNHVVCKEALTDYQRIYQEYQINQVTPQKVTEMDQGIVRPLTDIDEFGFPRARNSLEAFRKALANKELSPSERRLAALEAGKNAREKLQQVIANLRRVMDLMGQMINLEKVIRDLRLIEQAESDQGKFLRELLKKLQDELFAPSEKPKKDK
jgi:hypothetical protein